MTRFTVRELECFVAVAGTLNFSRAAEQLCLSQPPLTRHIQALEARAGSQLFRRDTHGVELTPAGALLLEDARAILAQLDRAAEALRRARDGETSRLRLAFIGALLDENLVDLIQRFRHAHPTCQVSITDLAPSAQLAAIKAGELDGGFIGAKPASAMKELNFRVCRKEPLLLAVPETHHLAVEPAIGWKSLKGLNWVMVSRGAAAAFRQQFSDLDRKHALGARIIFESDRVPAILTMVAAGNGVTMIPQAATHLISKGVVFRSLPTPVPMLAHTFAWRRSEALPPIENFVKLLKS